MADLAPGESKVFDRIYIAIPRSLKLSELHLGKLGVKLTRLSKQQAEYIGVAPSGPFKPEGYRY